MTNKSVRQYFTVNPDSKKFPMWKRSIGQSEAHYQAQPGNQKLAINSESKLGLFRAIFEALECGKAR
jgi:hypothetical protein